MKVQVYMRTYAHYTADVELTAAELKNIADDYSISVEALTAEHIREVAEDKAFRKGVPGLCHMEEISLGGDWETDDKTEYAVEITER